MIVKTTADKLDNATVSHISLVDRGANRIPFKIVKEEKEKGMIDLSKIFKKDKPTKAVKADLAVSAIVVQKTEHLDEIKTILIGAGFSVEKMEDGVDGAVIFKQEDFDMADVQAIKLSDDVVVLTKSFNSYLGSESDFISKVKAAGFFPSLNVASDTLFYSIFDAVYETDAGEMDTLVTKVDSMINEYRSYVTTVIKGLPTTAFKAEKEITAVFKKVKDVAKKSDEEVSANAVTDPVVAAAVTEPASTDAVDTGDKPAAEASAATEPSVDVAVAKAVEASLTGITKSIADLVTSIEGVSKQVLDVAKSQETVTTKLSEVEKVAKSAQTAVKGTLIAGTTHGDSEDEETATVAKSASTLGNFDTAYQPDLRSHTSKSQKH